MLDRPRIRAFSLALLAFALAPAYAWSQNADTVAVSAAPAMRAIAVSDPVNMGQAEVLFSPSGAGPGEQFGNSVANAGDFNGDGYDDIIVGAWASDVGLVGDVGRAYIYYGGPAADGIPDVTFVGEASDNNFGTCVAGAGDMNGDGYADVIIGAYNFGLAGKAYVFYGGPSPDTIWDLAMNAEVQRDLFGVSVASAGDVNGDGFSDVIVGAAGNDAGGNGAGRAYIYFGGTQRDQTVDVVLTSPGGAAGNFGWSVSSARDWNADGYDDVIVGAHDVGSGRAYLYLGGPSMDNTPDRTFSGEQVGDRFGIHVASTRDINGDGFADVLVGSDANDAGGTNAGRVYVFYGGPDTDTAADLVFTGSAAGEALGVSCAGADLNGDGHDDVIAGAWLSSDGAPNIGRAYVFLCGPGQDLLPDIVMRGEGGGDRFGVAVSAAGDMDADGSQDFVVGAYFADSNGLDAGRAYVMTIGAAPVVAAPASLQATAGIQLAFTVTASDPDGDPIVSLTAGPLPLGAMFTSNATHTLGNFSWTPTAQQLGTSNVTFRAANGLVGLATTRIVVVAAVNGAPILSALGDMTVIEGEAKDQTLHATDPDGDPVLFTLNAGPAFASVSTTDATTGNLHVAPGFDDAGSYVVTVQADDQHGGIVTGSAQVLVSAANGAPVLTVPAGIFGAESVPIAFAVTASDPDGDAMRLGALNRPVGSLFIDLGNGTGNFNWTPGFGQAGSYVVTFTVRDVLGAVGASRDLEILVDDVNRDPKANPGGPYAGVINVPVSFNGSASSDPDGSPLTYLWDFGDLASGSGVTPLHAYGAGGTFTVTLTVSDGSLSDHAATIASVQDVFQARSFTTKSYSTIKLGSGKATWCAEIEPVANAFLSTSVIQATISLQYGTGRIFAQAGKASIGGDKDGNGVEEMEACFAKTDLRTLFGHLPKGTNTVTVELSGDLSTGGKFQAPLTVDVAGSGNLAATLTPNPLNPEGTITFHTVMPGRLKVVIFDLHGRLVRSLEPGADYQAGYHDLRFDGRNDRGETLSSGVYFYRIEAAEGIGTGQFVIAR